MSYLNIIIHNIYNIYNIYYHIYINQTMDISSFMNEWGSNEKEIIKTTIRSTFNQRLNYKKQYEEANSKSLKDQFEYYITGELSYILYSLYIPKEEFIKNEINKQISLKDKDSIDEKLLFFLIFSGNFEKNTDFPMDLSESMSIFKEIFLKNEEKSSKSTLSTIDQALTLSNLIKNNEKEEKTKIKQHLVSIYRLYSEEELNQINNELIIRTGQSIFDILNKIDNSDLILFAFRWKIRKIDFFFEFFGELNREFELKRLCSFSILYLDDKMMIKFIVDSYESKYNRSMFTSLKNFKSNFESEVLLSIEDDLEFLLFVYEEFRPELKEEEVFNE